MKVLDLFSGIGGFSLGLERAGMETVAFCEFDEHARKVLKKHWPDVPIHNDVRELDGKQYRGSVDVVCGGFPCQDLSTAGKQAGFDGERSSLYREMLRIISECMPKYAIFENVTGLLSGDGGRWFARFLYDLAEVGYDAEWHCIPASELGAHHHRDRVWIIAYPNSQGLQGISLGRDSQPAGKRIITGSILDRVHGKADAELCFAESHLGRKADGIPRRVDRLKCLGNAIVPQIAELIGYAISAQSAEPYNCGECGYTVPDKCRCFSWNRYGDKPQYELNSAVQHYVETGDRLLPLDKWQELVKN